MNRSAKKSGVGPLMVKFQFWGKQLKAEVSLNGTIVGYCDTEIAVGL